MESLSVAAYISIGIYAIYRFIRFSIHCAYDKHNAKMLDTVERLEKDNNDNAALIADIQKNMFINYK